MYASIVCELRPPLKADPGRHPANKKKAGCHGSSTSSPLERLLLRSTRFCPGRSKHHQKVCRSALSDFRASSLDIAAMLTQHLWLAGRAQLFHDCLKIVSAVELENRFHECCQSLCLPPCCAALSCGVPESTARCRTACPTIPSSYRCQGNSHHEFFFFLVASELLRWQ